VAAGLALHQLTSAPLLVDDRPGGESRPQRATTPGDGSRQRTVGPRRIALTQPGDELLGRAVPAGDADRNGMFAPQVAWPVIPIHVALQPDGHLVSYGTPLNTASQAGLVYDDWNPALGTAGDSHTDTPSMEAYNAFCNALQTLPDGRVLMVGGNSTNSTMYFDAPTGTESMGPDLNRARWYASVMRLTDDRILVLGGANAYNTRAYENPADNSEVATTPEIGDGRGAWRLLTGADSVTAFGARDNRWWYPRAFNAPDGTVFGVSGNQMWRLSAAGAGSVTSLGVIPSAIGVSGAAVMYAPGKILLAGGGQAFNEDTITATDASTTLDIRRATPVVTRVRPMANRRNWLNLTVLPTGEVLANGGTIVGTEGGAGNAVYAAEIWDPTTRTWRTAASAKRIRTYHSTSVLLPSGAVFTGGGGVPGPEDNLNAEIYYPPFLFTRNATTGEVAWASRPTITSIAGSLVWGGTIRLGLGDARTIASVSLISAGKVSHSVNQDQRRIPLAFTQRGRTVTAAIPRSRNTVPPGSYLLSVVDDEGVPSPSQMVTVRNGGAGSVTVYGTHRSAGRSGPGGTSVAGVVPLAPGRTVSLESANVPGYRVRHQDYAAKISPIGAASSELDRLDSAFVVREGLASAAGVSFESVNFPGFYLRIENGAVFLRRNDGGAAFPPTATFLAKPGLSGQNTSFVSYADRDLYLRHQDRLLKVQAFDGSDLFRRDATFSVRAPLGP